MSKSKRKKKMKLKVPKRNPLVAVVMKKGVRRHKNKKKEILNKLED